MELLNFEHVCEFRWVRDMTFLKLRGIEKEAPTKSVKCCYAGTQHRRVYVVWQDGSLRFVPYEFLEGNWRPLFPHQFKTSEFTTECLESEKSLKDKLAWQICLQWPMDLATYWDDPPEKEDVLASLSEGDTVETLHALKYHVYPEEIQRSKDWDDGIAIVCNNGVLVIPVVGEEQKLLLDYATFVSDSISGQVSSGFGKFVDRMSSFFGNIHWSDIREKINRIGGI